MCKIANNCLAVPRATDKHYRMEVAGMFISKLLLRQCGAAAVLLVRIEEKSKRLRACAEDLG